jgi:ABC-type nickel/cobalt efflux system permease component RcnA
MFAAFAGLFAGLVHVLAGPDHLAAVAPLAADRTTPQWRAGFQWGVGHTAGVVLVGVLLLAFRQVLPIDAISAYSERIVGLALVAVGIWGVRKARHLQVHRHEDGHVHAHVKPAPRQRLAPQEHAHQHVHPKLHGHARTRASFLMGTLHGLAGSSHLFGILPALAFSTQTSALSYLAGFGIGAIIAMTAFAAFVGFIAVRTGRRGAAAYRTMLYACSLSAFAVGGFWLVA